MTCQANNPGISFISLVIPQGVEDLVNLGQNFIFMAKKKRQKYAKYITSS